MFKLKIMGIARDYIKEDVSFNTYEEAAEFGCIFQIEHEWCYGFEVIKVD